MKKHIVIKANRYKIKNKFNIDYKTFIFFSFLAAGIIIGVFISENGSTQWHTFFEKSIKIFLSSSTNENMMIMFIRIFLPFLFVHILLYIIGLCGVGIPFLLLIPLMLGVFFGIINAQYYINFGLAGIVCCCLIFLPLYSIATATLIKCCCRCFDISGEIFYYLSTGKGDNKPILKEYTLQYLLYLLPTVLGSAATVILYKLFAHLFNFII